MKATRKFLDSVHEDWRSYETVRQSGRWNMYDPRAREASGLDREEYLFVLKNYSEIREEVERLAKTDAP